MRNLKFFIKLNIVYVLQFFMRILHIIPVKNNRIVFTSQMGKQYSCNPKYISTYLTEQYSGEFEIIWMLNEPKEYQFLAKQGIKVIKNHSLKKWYFELTAKVSVVNNGNRYAWMPPRKTQINIDTWHGGGYYKLCGLNENNKDKFEKRLIALASKNTSYFLSTNHCFSVNEIRNDFGYDGNILNIGSPRNDIFFHCNYMELHKEVCSYFGVNEECKIIMYAPTYRYNRDVSKFKMPDFEKLRKVAAKRFGGEWIVLTRMHFMMDEGARIQNTYNANYCSDMPEMQELLAASNMLISDYSSCIWDYSFTYRPCLLFTPDLEEYTANRGFGIDINDWGFPVCKTEQELWGAIEDFDEDAFRRAMERHHEKLGSFEHGDATKIMGELIYDFCFPEEASDS